MEGQTTQWPKEKGQKYKQWSTKRTNKTKDQVTRTPLKTEGWTQVLQMPSLCQPLLNDINKYNHHYAKHHQIITTNIGNY